MSPVDYLLIALVAAAFLWIVVRRVRRIRRGAYCDCSDCGGNCEQCKKHAADQDRP